MAVGAERRAGGMPARAAVCILLLAGLVGGCSPQQQIRPGPVSAPAAPASLPPVEVATPYRAPPSPPQHAGPLDFWPTRDAQARLSRVLTGKLLDSGNFHTVRYLPESPVESDPADISFTTPSGNITCTGKHSFLTCGAISGALPLPPQPVEKPSGNWEPHLELTPGQLTYGVAAGNPLIPAHANTLPYGSTLRFGDIECLSATDGVTCAYLPSSTGFHLSRDDLTPLQAVDPVPADLRVEPRPPGNTFCGALVSEAAVLSAGKSLPHNGGLRWTRLMGGDFLHLR